MKRADRAAEDQAHALGVAHADALARAADAGEPLPLAPILPTAAQRVAFQRGLWTRRVEHAR